MTDDSHEVKLVNSTVLGMCTEKGMNGISPANMYGGLSVEV